MTSCHSFCPSQSGAGFGRFSALLVEPVSRKRSVEGSISPREECSLITREKLNLGKHGERA